MPTINDVQGVVRLSGIDTDGNTWTQFEVDYFAQQEPGECVECGATLESGWLCLDGGDEICDSHMEVSHGQATHR